MNENDPDEDPKLHALRELRLWHWLEAMAQNVVCDVVFHAPDSLLTKAFLVESQASKNFHLHAVQHLNEWFPVGDTAEQDAIRVKKRGKL